MNRYTILFVLCSPFVMHAQTSSIDSSRFVPEFKYSWNNNKQYIKFTAVNQIWIRHSEMNPGTEIDKHAVSNYTDVGIRRLRFSVLAQLTNRLFFYTQFGQNNFNFLSKRNTGAFFHDATTEYKCLPQLQIGAGLTGWSGLARFASPAVGSVMGIDVPLYQQVTNGVNDQFLRKLSVYAKGQISRLDYRLALSSPMTIANSLVEINPISQNAEFSLLPPKLQTQGYVFWQFLDKESNTLPYTTGTYLGKKKIVNLGAGWIHQKNAMWNLNDDNDTVMHDMFLLGADLFVDLPIGKKGAALSSYLAYTNYNLGPNYVRNVGVMNPANGTDGSVFNGSGVAFPMIGTGHTFYWQGGYKFKNDLLPQGGTFMPYASVQIGDYNRLNDLMFMWNAGLNYFIHGTHAGKLTLEYQSRPVFDDVAGDLVAISRKGMAVLQFQIAL
ncbi:MAG: hypothetical protein ACOVO3_03925 [Fluviicola sp.]